jgi:hypothetical protein
MRRMGDAAPGLHERLHHRQLELARQGRSQPELQGLSDRRLRKSACAGSDLARPGDRNGRAVDEQKPRRRCCLAPHADVSGGARQTPSRDEDQGPRSHCRSPLPPTWNGSDAHPRLRPVPGRRPDQPPASALQVQGPPRRQACDLPGRERALSLRVVGDALTLGRPSRLKELLGFRAPKRVGDELPVVFAEAE